MPKWLEEELMSQARKAGAKGEGFKAYVYGTMNKIKKAWAKKHPGMSLTKSNYEKTRR